METIQEQQQLQEEQTQKEKDERLNRLLVTSMAISNPTESIGRRNVSAHRRVQSTALFSILDLDSPSNMRHRVRSLSLAEAPSLDKYYPGDCVLQEPPVAHILFLDRMMLNLYTAALLLQDLTCWTVPTIWWIAAVVGTTPSICPCGCYRRCLFESNYRKTLPNWPCGTVHTGVVHPLCRTSQLLAALRVVPSVKPTNWEKNYKRN